jgi:putative methionine-R-sulfoxide reductase with GAF domain
MSIQSPLKDGLYIRPIRPDRRWIRYFVKYYSFIVGILISLVVFAPLYLANKLLPFLIVSGYWVYLFLKSKLRKNMRWSNLYSQTTTQLARGLLLITGVTLLLAYVYSETKYLDIVNNDALWLLYFPSILAISQRGSRVALFTVLFITILCLYIVSPGLGTVIIPFTKPITLELLIKCTWLILLSMTSYILLRYMSDAIADLNLIINIQNRMREMEGKFLRSKIHLNESNYLEKVVEIIKSDLNFDHVNVFRLDKFNKQLKCVAAACEDGKKLVVDGYTVDLVGQDSIIGNVVKTGHTYVTNNTDWDPYYMPHKAFPKTKAELVVPIEVRNRLYGVLDIQVHQPDYFLDQDLKAIEILANNIGWVIDNSEQYEHISWINRIVETIAAPMFTHTVLA